MDSLPEDGCNFDFAFNKSNFSDRLLRIYIESPQSQLEETGFLELLKFMYSNTLQVTSAHAILDVLIAADKFDVASCLRHCSRLLKNSLATTPEFLPVYLDLPSNILMAEALQPLTVTAKQLCIVSYKDIIKFEDEILSLPLVGVEAIIASDDLQVTSEYAVYLFVLKWVRFNYPKIEERREIMARLTKFIRYPFMRYKELTEVSYCIELEPCFALGVIKEAIAFKENALDPNYIMNNDSRRFVKRTAYKDRPIEIYKLRRVETPMLTCMVKCFTWAILSTWAIGLAGAIKGFSLGDEETEVI